MPRQPHCGRRYILVPDGAKVVFQLESADASFTASAVCRRDGASWREWKHGDLVNEERSFPVESPRRYQFLLEVIFRSMKVEKAELRLSVQRPPNHDSTHSRPFVCEFSGKRPTVQAAVVDVLSAL